MRIHHIEEKGGPADMSGIVVSLALAEFPSMSKSCFTRSYSSQMSTRSLNYDFKEKAMLTWQLLGNFRTSVNTFVLMHW